MCYVMSASELKGSMTKSLFYFFVPPGRLNRKEEGRKLKQQLYTPIGLLWCLSGKELPANAADVGSISGSGRSPGRGHINPLQYSCLGNPMGRRAWRATVHGVTKSWTWLSTQASKPISRKEGGKGEEEKMEGGRREKGKGGREGRKKARRDEKEDEKRQMFKCCNRSKEMKGRGHLWVITAQGPNWWQMDVMGDLPYSLRDLAVNPIFLQLPPGSWIFYKYHKLVKAITVIFDTFSIKKCICINDIYLTLGSSFSKSK